MKKPKLKLIAVKLTEQQLTYVQYCATKWAGDNVSFVIRAFIDQQFAKETKHRERSRK